MSLANDNEQPAAEIELSYGELTMIKLEELLGDIYGPTRAEMPVGGDFWNWRKENKARAGVLNKAGLVLIKTDAGWFADLTSVSADTLDEAVDAHRQWKRTEKELRDRANLYMRQCERARRGEAGETGRGALGERY